MIKKNPKYKTPLHLFTSGVWETLNLLTCADSSISASSTFSVKVTNDDKTSKRGKGLQIIEIKKDKNYSFGTDFVICIVTATLIF